MSTIVFLVIAAIAERFLFLPPRARKGKKGEGVEGRWKDRDDYDNGTGCRDSELRRERTSSRALGKE